MPDVPETIDGAYDIVITGIGGTGVVTIGALLGMAAHLEHKAVSVLDQTGLAQKNGAVVTHLRLAEAPDRLNAARIAAGNANLVLGADMLTAGSFDTLAKMREGHTTAVVNAHEVMTADFASKPDILFPAREVIDAVTEAVGQGAGHFVDATTIATAILGDSIATNLFLVGFAWQKGLIPLSLESIDRAIELNGVAIDFNKQAFLWGRRAAHDQAAVEALARPGAGSGLAHHQLSETLDEMIARRADFLAGYQNAAYGERYKAFVDKARAAEAAKAPGRTGLAEAVAKGLFKLMAYKDEYEVARLYTDGTFAEALKAQFEADDGKDIKLTFHMAPPILGNRDPKTRRLKKSAFGPWMMTAFKTLAKFKSLRGSALDPFGYTEERKLQRRLIGEYEQVMEEVFQRLDLETHAIAVELAHLPLAMRGFGHVLERNVEQAKAREADLLDALRHPAPQASAAE